MNIVEKFNKKQVEKLSSNAEKYFNFEPGDTVKVSYRIKEGETTRIQVFEGVVIAKNDSKNNYTASLTVRKISHGVGVERKFLLHSPLVEKVEVVKKGIIRRGKLYYLRNLKGKSARIQEKLDTGNKTKNEAATE